MTKTITALFAGLLVFFVLAFAPKEPWRVSGAITDTQGNPLPFATVIEKGTKNATAADANGKYNITISHKNSRLVFSATGYSELTEKVKGRSTVNVKMNAANQSLQEVVVTAYGIERQERALGYSTTMNGALAGKVSGLTINGYANSVAADYYTEGYDAISENSFHRATDDPLSTFSIDVDGASYSNVRRFLNDGQLPPAGAVRVEEMINYFSYNYPQPTGEIPFAVHTELGDCPWNKTHKILMVGLQGKKIAVENLPPSNLVFLIDVSGSMQSEDKLPLVKSSLRLLVDQMREQDRISLVVYAGNAGLVLAPTAGSNKSAIREAIDKLEAGGSTAGGQGIKLAYKVAREHFVKDGNNRVILCTDGDFNVGASSNDEMETLIVKERESGVYLTVLGYGTGNYQDSKMQILADKGNGNHAYIDGIQEARKVLVNEFGGTLFTISKDVKLQVEFNPTQVQGYRLIGYENRMLQKEDFNDDRKDAGELGSGHTVTALYEIIPAGIKDTFLKKVDDLKYQQRPVAGSSTETATVKLRYKDPKGGASQLIDQAIFSNGSTAGTQNFRLAVAVAEFGMLLRNSSFKQNASFNHVYQAAKAVVGEDKEGYRKEFVNLVRKASQLKASEINEDEDDVVLQN